MDFQRLCNCYVVPEVGANEQVTSTYQPFESFQKLSDTAGNFCPPMGGSCLADYEALGDGGNAGIGDLDGDGIDDLAVGARQSGADYNFHGAVFIIFLRVDGTVRAHQKIADTEGVDVALPLADGAQFGTSLCALGDVDGDGNVDIAVGAEEDFATTRGTAYILFLRANGFVAQHVKVEPTMDSAGFVLSSQAYFGSGVAASAGFAPSTGILAVGAQGVDDGIRDGGAIYILFFSSGRSLFTVDSFQKISRTSGNFVAGTNDLGSLGRSLAFVGDLDGNSVTDLVTNINSDDGNKNAGALWVLFLNSDGTVLTQQKISSTSGAGLQALDPNVVFGWHIAARDIDGDGVADLAVSTYSTVSLVWVLFLKADGTINREENLDLSSITKSGADEFLGVSIAMVGDLDNNGAVDLAIAASRDGDGGNFRGAVYVVFGGRVRLPSLCCCCHFWCFIVTRSASSPSPFLLAPSYSPPPPLPPPRQLLPQCTIMTLALASFCLTASVDIVTNSTSISSHPHSPISLPPSSP
jgi:hypothetical protein